MWVIATLHEQSLREKFTALLWLKKTEFKRNNVKTMYNGTKSFTFLGPRIWKIVPDYFEKSNSFDEFNLEIKLWNPENCPCRLCERFLPQVGFL